MTEILLLAYVILALLTGFACLGAAAVLRRRGADKLVRAFLAFYLPFTFLVLTGLTMAAATALGGATPSLVITVDYLESFIGRYGLMLALPLFAHRLYDVHSTRRDGAVATLVIGAFAGQHVTEFVLGGAWDRYGDLAEDVLFAVIVVYTVWVARRGFRGAGLYAPAGRRFLVLLLAGMPMIGYDIFIADGPGLRLYPLWYAVLGVTLVYTLAVRAPAGGVVPPDWNLSDREVEILRSVQQGLSNEEIADALVISTNTVKTHLRAVFDKSGIRSRTGLMAALNHPKE